MSYGFIKEFDYLKSFISKQQIIEVFKGVATKDYWRVKSHLGITKLGLRGLVLKRLEFWLEGAW